jgi:hypothetical protein
MYRYIRKEKVLEYLEINERGLDYLIKNKKLIPYSLQGAKAFFKLKDVYKLIEDRRSDAKFIKDISTTYTKDDLKLKAYQEKFLLGIARDLLSMTFKDCNRQRVVDAVLSLNGDFTLASELLGFTRTFVLTVFRQALSKYKNKLGRANLLVQVEKEYEKLKFDYDEVLKMNSKLIEEIETLTSVSKMNAEANLSIMRIEIADIDLSLRAFNVLRSENIINLYDLSQWSIPQLKKIRNSGLKTVEEIEQVARKYGLELKKH